MKKNKWLLLIGLGSFLLTLLIYPNLPEQVPIHWSSTGKVDSYGTKYFTLLLGAMPVGLYYMMLYLPRIDPRRENYAKHSGAYQMIQSSIIIFFTIVHWIAIAIALGFELNIGRLVSIGIGILFIIIGNYMSQIRHNYFVGIKTPWTLANEVVWRKTHRVGGVVFVIAGLMMSISSFLPEFFSGC
jgi:uncharacterized membrane protein